MAYAVCPRCEGKGSIVNPSVDGHGITAEEMDELGPEFFEDYMSGVYDVACPYCKGLRVVPQCANEGCTDPIVGGFFYNSRDEQVPYEHCDEHLDQTERDFIRQENEYWAEVEAERRAGA